MVPGVVNSSALFLPLFYLPWRSKSNIAADPGDKSRVDHDEPQRIEGVQVGRVEKRIVLRELTELNWVRGA